MNTKRLPLDKSFWFVINRSNGEYKDYGFPSKTTAIREVEFLNAAEKAEGRKGEFAVIPTYAPKRPPPKLRVIKGEKA